MFQNALKESRTLNNDLARALLDLIETNDKVKQKIKSVVQTVNQENGFITHIRK